MKKILLLLSFVFLIAAPQVTHAGGTVNVGLGCTAYFDWSSSNATSCGTNPPSGTSQPLTYSINHTEPKTITCTNDYGQTSDTAIINWSNTYPSCSSGTQLYSCGSSGTSCAACGGASQPSCVGSTYTTSNCNNLCAAAPTLYACTGPGGACQADNVNGYTTSSYCNNSCIVQTCGNGIKEGTEACDAGGSNGVCPSSCSSTCTLNSCGTGTNACAITAPATGYTGTQINISWNSNVGSGYSAAGCGFNDTPNSSTYNKTFAAPATSGTYQSKNLVSGSNVWKGYCDYLNASTGITSRTYCPNATTTAVAAVCGNGIMEGSESCDNGGDNGASPATCSSSCTWNTCGGGSCSTTANAEIGFNQSFSKSTTTSYGASTVLYWSSQNTVASSCSLKETTAGNAHTIIAVTSNTSGTSNIGIQSPGTHTYVQECRKSSDNSIFTSGTATLTVNSSCGNGICDNGETCSTCGGDCGACVDNSLCQSITVSPNRILVGKTFTGNTIWKNIGSTNWSTSYTLRNITGTNWGVSSINLPVAVQGANTYATTSVVINATAPSTAGTYPFSWKLYNAGGTTFGDTCSAGNITVALPQCNDGIDNESPTPDGKIDCADPQCLNQAGVCNKECDDETLGCDAKQTLVATPSLVRNGASSVLTWSVTNNPGACTLTGPGLLLNNADTVSPKTRTISNITQKQTYYLTCGGLTTKATISVVKFVEPQPTPFKLPFVIDPGGGGVIEPPVCDPKTGFDQYGNPCDQTY